MESKILKVFASLGVPGLALGIFYMLFRTFHWDFPEVPVGYVGPIIVLFMVIIGAIVFYALNRFTPHKTIIDAHNGDQLLDDFSESKVNINDLRKFFQSIIKNEQAKYVRESYGESAAQCFTWDDLNTFQENGIVKLIEHRLEKDEQFISQVKSMSGTPARKKRELFSELEQIYKPTWAQLGRIAREGQTDAGQIAEKMISSTIVKLIKRLSE